MTLTYLNSQRRAVSNPLEMISLNNLRRNTAPSHKTIVSIHSFSRPASLAAVTKRGMKSAADQALKLFTNAKGSYPVANRRILEILAEKAKTGSPDVEKTIIELQKAVGAASNLRPSSQFQLQTGLESLLAL